MRSGRPWQMDVVRPHLQHVAQSFELPLPLRARETSGDSRDGTHTHTRSRGPSWDSTVRSNVSSLFNSNTYTHISKQVLVVLMAEQARGAKSQQDPHRSGALPSSSFLSVREPNHLQADPYCDWGLPLRSCHQRQSRSITCRRLHAH